jgi:hypothetical protein
MTTTTTIVNLTPHALVLLGPSGEETIIPPSGAVARVTSRPGAAEALEGVPVPVIGATVFGEVEGLPAPVPGTYYLVSGLVAGRTSRADVLAPATGPNDNARRDEAGRITGVRALVRAGSR